MELDAVELVRIISSDAKPRKRVSVTNLRLRNLFDPMVAKILASSYLAKKVEHLDLTDGEVNDATISALLLTPPCLTPKTVDMRGWHCVLALSDGVRNRLAEMFRNRLWVTNQHWGR